MAAESPPQRQPGKPPDSEPPRKPDNLLSTALGHPEEVSKLIKEIAGAVADSLVRLNETRNRHERRLAYLVGALLALIVSIGGALTVTGHLDAAAFAFLAGPIVGGLITFLVDSLSPPSNWL